MRNVLTVLVTILLAIYIPLAALMVVSSAPVCQFLLEDALKQSTESKEERDALIAVAMGVRDFTFGNDDADMPTGEDYRTAITPDAVDHLLDVRSVFLVVEYFGVGVLLALILLLTLTVRRYSAAFVVKPLIIGGAIPLVAAIALGIYSAVDFNAFFAWLHGLFFAAGTWTFPAESLLITSLPYQFWVSCAVFWAIAMVLLCAISIGVGVFFQRRTRRLEEEAENPKPKKATIKR